MSQAWSKVRSFVRGAFVALDPEAANGESRPASETAPSHTATSTPIYREVAAPPAAAETVDVAVRDIDSKAEAIRARVDALEARLRDQPARTNGPTPDRAPDERIGAFASELADVRLRLDDLAKQQTAVRLLAEELGRHLADLSTAMAVIDRRSIETARDVTDAQASADEAMESLEHSHADLRTWAESRGREVGQRLVPLYVISLIALLAALAAAAMTAAMMMQ